MKKKLEITKLKVFRINGEYYTGVEIEGEDYCYIRSNPNGYFEFLQPRHILGKDYLGRTKRNSAPIVFRYEDFEMPHELSKVVHYTAGWLAAEDDVEYTEVE